MVSSAGLAFQGDPAMRPPSDLLVLFLEAKEDSWMILKALFQRDGENARLRVVEVDGAAPQPKRPVDLYT